MTPLKLGSHVGMKAPEMLLGAAKESISYGANTFMIYTGAPQNTRRKAIEELNIDAGASYISAHGIEEFIVHAPYIINLANSVKPDTFQLAVDFLALEIERTKALGSPVLILHPGSHVGAGKEIGTRKIIEGLNEVLTRDMGLDIALEAMAGKGSEVGDAFDDLARIYEGVRLNDKLRVCFDTCHIHDAGYDIIADFDGVINRFDQTLGKDQIAVFHINDSKNERGAKKDRHENIGYGYIGFTALNYIVHHKDFMDIPKILETPYIKDPVNPKKSYAPYKYEIEMLHKQEFYDFRQQAKSPLSHQT